MKNNCVIILILILFSSCNSEKRIKFFSNKKSLEFLPEKDMTLILGEKSSNFFMLSQEVEIDNDEYLIFCNPFPTDPNMIFFNNLQDSEKSFTLDFEIEGPNGVGEMTEFYFHSFDSIFIFDRYAYQLSLVDSMGIIKRKYSLRGTDGIKPEENTVISWLSNKSKPVLINNFLYIPSFPDEDPYHSNYSKENLLMELNLASGEFELTLGFPSKYRAGGFWGGPYHILPSISRSSNPNELLISFPVEDSIFTFDIKKQILKPAAYLKSSLLSEMNPNPNFSLDRQEMTNYQLGTDYYFSLLYDPYRDQYYRIANQKYSEESIQKMLNREPGNPNKQNLLVFDSNFNKINEFELPSGFTGFLFFIFESGVYMVKNIDDDEDELDLHYISNF